MPLTAGTRVGPYEILAPIGAGGMGEVYRARDTKLDREVAIKILPAAVSSDPERLARLPGVDGVARAGAQLTVTSCDGAGVLASVARAVGDAAVSVKSLTLRTPTLDDVFMKVTGSHLDRDGVLA